MVYQQDKLKLVIDCDACGISFFLNQNSSVFNFSL